MADDLDHSLAPPGYTPFSTTTTDPSGATKTLQGYGPRRPIQPPSGVGPDIGSGIAQAFQHLPVDEAAKAMEAAVRYQGLRGYQKDLASGKTAAEAFAKWGPMLFHTGTGIPEALKMQPQAAPKTYPGQGTVYGGKFYPAKPAPAPAIKTGAGGGIYRVGSTGGAEELVAPVKKPELLSPEKHAKLTDAYKQLDEARKDMSKLVANPTQDKEYQGKLDDATMRMRDARETIIDVEGVPRGTTPNPANPTANAPPTPNPAAPAPKVLTKELAGQFLKQAGGDKEKARKLAKDAGFSF